MFSKITKYFIRGLVYLAPIGLTVYIIVGIITWLNNLLHIGIPGVGLAIALVLVTLLGYLGSMFISSPFFDKIEKMLLKIPLFNIIYTSIKDLVNAFAGDKNKFNKPVLVKFNKSDEVYKPGFITGDDFNVLKIEGFVSVYLPHSYNFSGNIFIVPIENIIKVEGIASVDFMKFIVSGGVTHLPNKSSLTTK